MVDLEVGFPVDSAYYDFPSLPPKLGSNMTSMSGLAGNLGVATVPYVDIEWYEFIFLLPMAAGVAVSGAVLSDSQCYTVRRATLPIRGYGG